MKLTLFAFAIALLFSNPTAQACCGDGVSVGKLPAAVEADCSRKALDLTLALASAQYPKSPEDKPQVPFKKDSAHLASVKNKLVTMSTSVISENGWDCLYCVNFEISSEGECVFRSTNVNHCAK